MNRMREHNDRVNRETREWLFNVDEEVRKLEAEFEMLETRLDALERAHWHDGIENNCTECREVWNK